MRRHRDRGPTCVALYHPSEAVGIDRATVRLYNFDLERETETGTTR